MEKKFTFTKEELTWLKRNLKNFTGRQLFEHVMKNRPESKRAEFTTFRTELYSKNLKKCVILRWTKEETRFLLDNYKSLGNKEIARKLSKSGRRFNKKNVEKKMKLLGLKRTEAERLAIIEKHKKKGTYSRANFERWEKVKIQDGEKKIQVKNGYPQVSIKVEGVLVRYARYRYEQLHGKLPRGLHVHHKDLNPLNVDDDNLIARPPRKLNQRDKAVYRKHCEAYFRSVEDNEVPSPEPEVKANDNTGGRIPVRVNSRTIVYVAPGTNIKKLKEQYQNIF